tara:strand:- start:45 stop:290 length:246 start_codon:yes stop_codon:yes gene_type:complete
MFCEKDLNTFMKEESSRLLKPKEVTVTISPSDFETCRRHLRWEYGIKQQDVMQCILNWGVSEVLAERKRAVTSKYPGSQGE